MQIANRESFAVASRRRMVAVEWLACTATGREWVDTGFIPSSVTDVLTVDAAYTGTGSAFGCLFGVTSRVNGNQRFYQINKTTTSNQFRLITSTGDVFWTKTPEFSGARHRYVLNRNILYIDGTQTITGSGTSAETATLYLFARNNRAGSTPGIDTYQTAWRIYRVKVERNGVVQLDLRPVRIGSVGYFYDRVSGALLPSGGDPLVVGPDKFTGTNPYVTNGLVAMWDGIWNAGMGKHTDDVSKIIPVVGTRVSISSSFTVRSDGLYDPALNSAKSVIVGLTSPVVDVGTGTGGGSTVELVMRCDGYRTSNGGSFFSHNPWTSGQQWECYAWPVSTTPNFRAFSGNVTWDTGIRFYADGATRSHVLRRVYDGSNNVQYWSDGAMKRATTMSGTTQISHTRVSLSLGGFSGALKAMRVYNRPLSAAEIIANSEVDEERFILP